MRALHGVLVLDKPAGLTSAVVVARARHALRADKIGHTGTLDPLATGVLPLVLGEATKLAGHLLADDKAYEAELVLGVETDTLDAEGAVTARAPEAAAAVTAERIRAALPAFTGTITQVPPMFSAIKLGGRRLHQLARDGEQVDVAPREVRVDALELLEVAPPRVRLAIACSKGTYVRTLVADLGRALGCGAHLAALRRTRSGPFTLADAVTLAELQRDPAAAAARLRRPADLLPWPRQVVPADQVDRVGHGHPPAELPGAAPDQIVQLVTPAGDLLALATSDGAAVRLLRVFHYGLTPAPGSSKVPASS